MSVYAHIQAEFKYDDKESFQRAVDVLKRGGWINKNGVWLDEGGKEEGDAAIDFNSLVISVPDGYYRNLLHHIPSLSKGASSKRGCWASSDGMFEGGDIGGESLDLEEWAKEEGFEPKPQESEFDDELEYFENLAAWQEGVIHAFMGRP